MKIRPWLRHDEITIMSVIMTQNFVKSYYEAIICQVIVTSLLRPSEYYAIICHHDITIVQLLSMLSCCCAIMLLVMIAS
jgi:hypothetical protein